MVSFKKIRTKVQKSVQKSVLVRTNPYEWEHCTEQLTVDSLQYSDLCTLHTNYG